MKENILPRLKIKKFVTLPARLTIISKNARLEKYTLTSSFFRILE